MAAMMVNVRVPASLPALVMALVNGGAIKIATDDKGKVSSVDLKDLQVALDVIIKKTAAGDKAREALYDGLLNQVVQEIDEIVKGGVLPMMP